MTGGPSRICKKYSGVCGKLGGTLRGGGSGPPPIIPIPRGTSASTSPIHQRMPQGSSSRWRSGRRSFPCSSSSCRAGTRPSRRQCCQYQRQQEGQMVGGTAHTCRNSHRFTSVGFKHTGEEKLRGTRRAASVPPWRPTPAPPISGRRD